MLKKDGKFDMTISSHEQGEAAKEILLNIIQVCEGIKVGIADDMPFDFMGETAYLDKKANESFKCIDNWVGNIIYTKERVD